MINSFSSFFEIFAGLNLAFAGSKGFRNIIENSLFNFNSKEFTDKINELKLELRFCKKAHLIMKKLKIRLMK